MRSSNFVFSLLIAGALVLSVRDAAAQSAIDRLGWLTGCWEMSRDNGAVEEQWNRPRARTLFGVSRTIRRDTVVSYEFLRLFTRGDTLVYESQPSGQPKAE